MTNNLEPSSKSFFPPLEPRGGRFDLREMLRIVNRGRWKLIGTVVLACVLTGAVLVQLTPEYRATTFLVFDVRQVVTPNTPDSLGGLTPDAPLLQTEVDVIQSASSLGRVVDKLNLGTDPEYRIEPIGIFGRLIQEIRSLYVEWSQAREGAPPPRLDDIDQKSSAIVALARSLNVATHSSSRVIGISVDSIDPEKARHIADAIAKLYVEDRLQAKLDATTRASQFFAERSSELKRHIEVAERTAAAFREEAGLTRGKDVSTSSQALSDVNAQLIQTRIQRMDRESRLVALQQAQRNPSTLNGVAEVLTNPLISGLRGQEGEVARRIADLSQRFGDSHPRLQQAQAEREQIRRLIATEVAKIASSLQGDAEAARSKESRLEEQLSQLEHQAGQSSPKEDKLRQLEREVETSRLVYEDFLKRFGQLREQLDIQRPVARVLSPAMASSLPVYPRYTLALGLAFLSGLALGVIWIWIVERLDGGLRSGEQIERFTGRPLVAMVPNLSRSTLRKRSPVSFAIDNPTSAYAESLRSAYTAIVVRTSDKPPPRVIMITSSVPGEGKSTFVCSLASLLALSNQGKKIIVIDCDLRRSSVGAALGVSTISGTINEYLSGTKPLHEVIGRTKAGLFYILARPNTPNSAETLDSVAMRNLVKALSDQFDVVLLDTPPLMAVSDGRIAARISDYIVFLIRWETTARELAVNALKLIQDVDKNVGVVLSQVDVRRHSRYGYGDYGHYYSKYHDYYKG